MIVAAAMAIISSTLAGCGPSDIPISTRTETEMPVYAEKSGSGERRSDVEPLARRFPLIGEPVAAVWYAGTMGSEDVPGPSTYWIDAVVTVDADTAAQIEASYGLQPTDDVPEVIDSLKADVPVGLWASPDFNRALTMGGNPSFTTIAYYSPATRQIVISALGQ